jgi:hypothetical protein
MPGMVKRFVLAAALAGAAIPAWSAGMPDYGTKNFSPGGDAPSYFSNENGSALGLAANESMDDGGDAPIRSVRAAAEPNDGAWTASRHRHGKFASSRRSGSHRAIRWASAGGTRTVAMGRSSRSTRSATTIEAATKGRALGAGSAKHARSSVGHASARASSRKG